MEISQFAAAFAMGLLGAGHCLGMCGSICAMLALGVKAQNPVKRTAILLAYNLGRIGSYTLAGALVAALGAVLQMHSSFPFLRLLASALLIATGLYLANWWRGLTVLERAGQVVWRRIQPLGNRLLPVQHLHQALLLGMLWGWLPCGLVYGALTLAASAGSVAVGAGTMLAFGLGTLPALLAGAMAATTLKWLIDKLHFRQIGGALLICAGLWNAYTLLGHARASGDDSVQGAHEHHHMH